MTFDIDSKGASQTCSAMARTSDDLAGVEHQELEQRELA